MGYATVGELINDLASYYNDTDAVNYNLPLTHQRRILHYIQRTTAEIWFYRPWNFRYAQLTGLAPSSGNIELPYNFANVGRDGGLYEEGNNSQPWAEVAMQELMTMRLRPGYTNEHKFCIGYPTVDPNVAVVGQGGNYTAYQQYLMLPNTNDTKSFTLIYEVSCPRVGWDPDLNGNPVPQPDYDFTLPIPLPETFHNCLLLGSVAKLQESKGDPKSSYKSEFIAALAKMAAQHVALKSRMQQLPMATGGMW
jgi:hypothetical protein